LGKTYLLTGIDHDLQRDFKTACVYFDISMKAMLIKHMQNIVNDYRKAKRGLETSKNSKKRSKKP